MEAYIPEVDIKLVLESIAGCNMLQDHGGEIWKVHFSQSHLLYLLPLLFSDSGSSFFTEYQTRSIGPVSVDNVSLGVVFFLFFYFLLGV